MSRNQIKVIAVLVMLVDHINYFFLGNDYFIRMFGSMAFPLFVFLLADGFRRTSDLEKYALRILFFWGVSIVPYSLAFYKTVFSPHQSVLASLFLYLALFCVLNEDLPNVVKAMAAALFAVAASEFQFAYGWYGVLVAVILFYYKDHEQIGAYTMLFAAGLLNSVTTYSRIQVYASFGAAFMPSEWGMPDSRKPSRGLSLLVYLFYPLHLLFFALLKL